MYLYTYFSFHRIGIVILFLHYISGFTKHAVKLIDIIEKEEDSKRAKRNFSYIHTYFHNLFAIFIKIFIF